MRVDRVGEPENQFSLTHTASKKAITFKIKKMSDFRLAAGDLSLVARDTILPGLQTVLDPQLLLGRLRQQHPEVNWKKPAITYVQYKPQAACLAAYRIEANGLEIEFYGKAYPVALRHDLGPSYRGEDFVQRLGTRRVWVNFEEIATTIYFFPSDRNMSGLTYLAPDHRRKRLLKGMAPGSPYLATARLQGVRYKPERRYVAKLMHEGIPCATLKTYAPAGYRTALANSHIFRSEDVLRIPKQLGCSNEHGILLFQWLPGSTLREVLTSSRPDVDSVLLVGRALASLQGQPGTALPLFTREEEMRRTIALADWLSFVCPELAPRVSGVSRKLSAAFAALPAGDSPCHGDFYADQVILLPEGSVGVLDLDQASRVERALDLGLFLAHLERDILENELPGQVGEKAKAAFLTGYSQVSSLPDPDHLVFYTAVGLFRLTPDPFRRRNVDWFARTEALLKRVETYLHDPP